LLQMMCRIRDVNRGYNGRTIKEEGVVALMERGGCWGVAGEKCARTPDPAALLPPPRGKATGTVVTGPIGIHGGNIKICALVG
jgi:hypothetical protein